jgi:putative phosphoribosyl transferase
MRIFRDRAEGGRALAALLQPLLDDHTIIVGLARGGVETAKALADRLHLPLDVACPRKIGAPHHAELAIGAVSESGEPVWNEALLAELGVDRQWLQQAVQEQAAEAKRRVERFRADLPLRNWQGRTVVLVDDGLATGATMRAALLGARREGATRIIVAVPVSPPDTAARIRAEADEFVCLETPLEFGAVGQFYEQFDQVSDDEVVTLMRNAKLGSPSRSFPPSLDSREVQIPLTTGKTKGHLVANMTLPEGASQCVLFVHGSGSSRHSPRNERVAQLLHQRGIATLLVDLLTEQEAAYDEQTSALRFDIDLLASRVLESIRWLKSNPATGGLAIGLYGASTGAAAALIAAAAIGAAVFAVVSRGGRPDLAGESLRSVRSPSLLIVGGNDYDVLTLNQQAYEQLVCPKRLQVVPGATHLFEEPGTLELAAEAAIHWFEEHAPPTNPRPAGKKQS